MLGERKTFMAMVTGNSLQKSSVSKTPSVAIRVQTEYDVEEPEKLVEMGLIGNLWLTYKCMKQTIKSLQEGFGWEGHSITDFNEPILVGRKCEVVCEEEEYKGEVRWGIKFFNRPGGLKKMAGEELLGLVNDVQPMVDKMVGERADIGREEEERSEPVVKESSEVGADGTDEEEQLPF